MSVKTKSVSFGERLHGFADRKWDKIDLIFMIVVFVVCYVCFVQGDIVVTGNRSFLMHGNPFTFYDRCYEWTNDYGANYLPSTFVLFGIWNLPLRLFGRVPADLFTNAVVNNMWYKLLPVLFMVASAFVIERICRTMGMGELKSKTARYLFMISPLVLFPQMIFSQYDIFTVFFILLGYYSYLNKHNKRFVLFFAIAITFKYHALLYFIALLVLREKRILRILLNTILVILPTAVMILIYYPSDAFRKSVLNFGALTYVDTGVNLGGLRPINIFLLVLILLFVFAYIKKPEDEQSEIQWGLFLLNGVSFAFFGFVYFHPQWIIICAPFIVISVIRCRYSKMLYIVQNILIIALYFISVQSWSVNIDQQMMAYGVLKKFIPGQWTTVMADYFSYDNQVYMFTAIFAILLLFVVFSHPKFMQKDITVFEPDTMLNARIVFVVAFLAWCIPAFLCLKNTIDASKTAEASYTVLTETGGKTADIGTLINNVSNSI